VPVFYSYFEDLQEAFGRLRGRVPGPSHPAVEGGAA